MLRSEYSDNRCLRESLYEGEIFLLDAVESSQQLVGRVKQLLTDSFGENYRDYRHSLDEKTFFEKISKLRRTIYLEPEFHKLIAGIVQNHGFDLDQCLMDPARLRVITHKGHENPKAQPVYYAHRDTWYSHSQSLITWWIPLDDLTEEETFIFYPDYFKKEVPNNSEIFNYDDWVKDGWDLKIGWQNKNDGINAQFPSLMGSFNDKNAIGFSCKKGQNLLFSGSQFHQTRSQSLKRTRFSLDFRLVVKTDHDQNLGAVNVDNRSQGSTMKDYFELKV